MSGLPQGEGAAQLIPVRAFGLDGPAAGLDGSDGVQHFFGGASNDKLLLLVQQGQQFAILLQFFP